MQPQAQAAAPESGRRSPARTALRMAVYPALAITLVVALYFNPRVREEYYYWQWVDAEKEKEREAYFQKALKESYSWDRRLGYVRKRAEERLKDLAADDKVGLWFDLITKRGYGLALVPTLAKALGDEDELVRYRAAVKLSKIGPAAKDAVSALIKALGGKDEKLHWLAAYALGKIGPAAKESVPALKKALQDPDAAVRWAAAAALKNIEKEAAKRWKQ